MKPTVQVNNKTYDARTGRVIAQSQKPPQHSQSTNGTVMDGVSRIKRPTPSYKPRVIASTRTTDSRQSTVQKSQTLNRKVVQKPVVQKKPVIHSTSANVSSKVERSATGRGMLLKRVPDVRLKRVSGIAKSNKVSKFITTINPQTRITHDLTVTPAPIQQPRHIQHPQQTHPSSLPVQTPPSKAAPKLVTKKFVFEESIKNANTHLLKPVKKVHGHKKLLSKLRISPKMASATMGIAALLLVGGFLAYQHIPQVSMRIAASKAGFNGKLPGSVPAGYAFKGPIMSENNVIAVSYRANADDRSFTIVQKPTNWSSEALLSNFLIDSQYRYQTYRDKGLTVYIYNGNNATWIDSGVWFTVNGQDTGLSSEQLLEIASSI